MLVRPSQQRIVIDALMHRTPTWSGLCLPFERGVTGTYKGLPDVIEAMRGMVGDFLREVRAAVALLEVLDEVGQAVELVEG